MEKTFRSIKYGLTECLTVGLFECLRLLFGGLSLRTLILISRTLATLTFYLHKRYRQRVVHNLSLAFEKEKNLHEIKCLTREVFFHFTLTPLETICLCTHAFSRERFPVKIEIKGKECLDEALDRGRGVIALGAHFGSFTLVGPRLAAEGYPFNFLVNVGNLRKLWEKLAFYSEIFGLQLIPLKPMMASIKKSLNCLHRNEILYMVADEQQRRGGLPVPFFGQIAYTSPGPAILSLKTGAPILPMFVLREDASKRTLVIGSSVEIERTLDEKKDAETLTAKFTKAIEEIVRQHPDQWAWLNRRWKIPRSSLILDRKTAAV
jgi:KDO2-lipid IV(A) lauroyltransferase